MEKPPESEPSEELADQVDDALEAMWRGENSEMEHLLGPTESGTPGLGEMLGSLESEAARSELRPDEPQQIGDYLVRSVLGRGGMGTVYLAVQEHPRRTVALKVMKSGIASRSALRRFGYESQILARLRHPNIAQVYEAGTYWEGEGEELPGAGVPYFAMEYIPNARPITDYARLKKLGTRQRLELFAKVCDAVHHGHQKGIIHRDLKPGNILVDSDGEPKIIDFGVARSTDSDMAVTTLQTDVGQLIGTLQYMSPEQCDADPHDVDVRSDVYALGVVLYELLTGQLPYDVTKLAVYEAMKLIREEKPAKPSTLDRTLRGDIETIALKALEKERHRRYRSAADLGDDIRRYLGSEPIEARPPSVLYQMKMFARRNRVVFGAGMSVFAVLTAATVVSLLFALAAERARQAAETEAEQRLIAEREALAARDEEARQRQEAEAARGEAQENLTLAEEREAEAQRQAEIAQAVNDFLTEDLLAAVAPSSEPGEGRDVLMRDVLDAASEKIEEASQPGGRFADKPLIEASIRATLGETYCCLGEYARAAPHMERARRVREWKLGEEHIDTLDSTNDLAALYYYQGRYEEVEHLWLKTLEISRHVLGEEHPGTLDTMSNLAVLYDTEGRYDEAEPLCLRTLEISRRVLGEEHPDTLESMNNLALLYKKQGRYDKAEPLYVETLEIRGRVLGEEHPSTLVSMNNLAVLYAEQGRYDEAEPLCIRLLDIKKRVLGEEHPGTLISMGVLANLYFAQGRHEEAEAAYEQIFELRKRALGETHPDTLLSMYNLAVVYYKRGRHNQAEATALECYEHSVDRYGSGHSETIDAISLLIDIYTAWHEAEPDKGYDAKAEEWRAKLPPAGNDDAESQQSADEN
jgi:tetratricopeptide (TPR) repeat protein